MSEPKPAADTPVKRDGRGVLCPKCEHLNPLALDTCETCHTPLFAPCPQCGHRNPCVLDHCEKCERPDRRAPLPDNLASRPMGQGVLCAKCEHLNPLGPDRCETCQTALFAPCPRCGHRNPRVLDHCEKCERIPASDPFERAAGRPTGLGVLCVKCEHLNPADQEKCAACDAHLHVFCARCGHRNARVHSRCEKCNRKLHRTVRERWKGGDEPRPVNLIYFGLTLAGLALLFVLFVWISGIRLPRLW